MDPPWSDGVAARRGGQRAHLHSCVDGVRSGTLWCGVIPTAVSGVLLRLEPCCDRQLVWGCLVVALCALCVSPSCDCARGCVVSRSRERARMRQERARMKSSRPPDRTTSAAAGGKEAPEVHGMPPQGRWCMWWGPCARTAHPPVPMPPSRVAGERERVRVPGRFVVSWMSGSEAVSLWEPRESQGAVDSSGASLSLCQHL